MPIPFKSPPDNIRSMALIGGLWSYVRSSGSLYGLQQTIIIDTSASEFWVWKIQPKERGKLSPT